MVGITKCFLVTLVGLISVTITNQNQTDAPEVNTSDTTLRADQEEVVAQHVNDLGLRIMKKMIEQQPGKNVVISPTSITGLLAMALLGSVGSTFDEMVKLIGFTPDVLENNKYHAQFGKLLHELNSHQGSNTMYANAVFVDEHVRLRELYRDFTQRIYHGTIANIDFRNPIPTLNFINQWVREHTGERIPTFLLDPLPTSTQVVLLSALYFSGQWEKPFTPQFTKNMTFHKEDGSQVEAELMLNYGRFNFAGSSDLDCDMVALPYQGGDTVFYVVKPRRHSTLTELLKRIDNEKLNQLINQSQNRSTVLRLPKMVLSRRSDLRNSLKALGVESMFTPAANFALMVNTLNQQNSTEDLLLVSRSGAPISINLREKLNSLPNPGVYVDSIIHEVQININEFGTEASAVSGGFLTKSAELLITNKPFYFFIRNEKTKLITFSAAIYDPTDL